MRISANWKDRRHVDSVIQSTAIEEDSLLLGSDSNGISVSIIPTPSFVSETSFSDFTPLSSAPWYSSYSKVAYSDFNAKGQQTEFNLLHTMSAKSGKI